MSANIDKPGNNNKKFKKGRLLGNLKLVYFYNEAAKKITLTLRQTS